MTRDFVSSSSLTSHTLPEGTRLHDYEINGLIGEGGFGIVYLAFDHSLGRRVAIKEYLPASMASRAHASTSVVLKSPRHEETFRLGLKSFVNEARLLARFDHPALVKVYRFWEENGTAYMVMPYYQGPTLKATLAELGRAPTEAELRGWLRPLLDALAVMHAAHCYHRDIAPDNILLTATGPLLLDFGAARHVISDMTHALTVVLKPGFAPIEQYGEVPSLTQGAWTDLYALAGVVYAAITGKAPVSAVERLIDDRHVPLATIAARTPARYSEMFVQAIDAALQLKPRDRPQTVAAFRVLLDGEQAAFADSSRSPLDFVSTFGSSLLEPRLETTLPPTHPEPLPHDERTLPDPDLPAQPPMAVPLPATVATTNAIPVQQGAKTSARKTPLAVIVALLGGLVVLVIAAWYWARPATVATPAPIAAPAPAATPTPTPAATPNTGSVNPPPAPVQVEPVTPPPSPSPSAETASAPAALEPPPAPAASPASTAATTPPPRAAAATPVPSTSKPAPRPAPPRNAPPTNTDAVRAKCSDILQKASLEPLTASEAAFLRKECR